MLNYQLNQTKIALLKHEAQTEESALQAAGFCVWSTEDPEFLYKKLNTDPVDMVLVDLDETSPDIFNVIQSIHSMNDDIPIITLSDQNNTINQIMAISSGADRNINKPFNVHIILSNIMAINRNRKNTKEITNNKLQNKTWTLDSKTWVLTAPDNSSLILSMREMLLLQALFNHTGEFLKKDELSEIVFKINNSKRKPSMDRLLNQLRSKANKAFSMEFPLKTAYLVGYAFTSPCQVI